jgi:hypothetical protein
VLFHEYRPSEELTKALTNAADMSGADTEGDVIMMSFNWNVDVSTNGGATWKRLDPTTIFPNSFAGGFCCDQIVTYVPSIDCFAWFSSTARTPPARAPSGWPWPRRTR